MSILEEYKVGNVASIYVIENFISLVEEKHILSRIFACKAKWKTVSKRRLQYWGGTVGKTGVLFRAPIPLWLAAIMQTITQKTHIFGYENNSNIKPLYANHVLVNEYKSGDGILPHTDGPCYAPAVAILSLSGPVLMRFKQRDMPKDASISISEHCNGYFSVLLNPRSLLVFKDEAYCEWLHGIDAVEEDELDASLINPQSMSHCEEHIVDNGTGTHVLKRTGLRVSLTVRRVNREHKGLLVT